MRNLKKFLALVLAMIMVVSAAAVVSADFTDVTADNRYADAINDLAVKGIVKGTTETTFGPTQDVERYQMALFMARALTGNTDNDADYQKGIVPFTDVTEYAGAIEYNYVNGIINGWTDVSGKLVFAPKSGITYVQALKMAVCALGYTAEGADWTWAYYNKAAALGLTNNMDITSLDDVLNRAETAQIIYNMLYAVPADGGLSIAEKNFDIQTAANTTTFVITATPKQYYAEEYTGDDYNSASDVEGDYVGIQKLVGGLPTGDILYYTCEQLGIAAAEVENYFNRAVELINFDEATKDFTSAVLGDAPKTVTYKDVTEYKMGADNQYKLTIDGTLYTVDDMLTGATLINELVIYAGNTEIETAQMLVVDEDGYVIYDGKIVGQEVYSSAAGSTYYVNYKTNKVITEAQALKEWGVEVIDEAAKFAKIRTMPYAYDLYNDAYELDLYDDDRDGLYERAVYTPIYMGVYYTYLAEFSGEEREADGLLSELNYKRTAKYVTYTDKAAQVEGAISVFTYNPQLNVVDVIDVLEVKTGELGKVNARSFSSAEDSTANTVKLTLDGKEYIVAYDMLPYAKDEDTPADGNTDEIKAILDDKTKADTVAKWSLQGAQLGAYAIEVEELGYDVNDLGDEYFLDLFNTKTELYDFIQTLNLGETYAFVEYNGYILMATQVKAEEAYNFAVVDKFSDFDLGELYLDLYIAGKLEEDAVVTEIAGYELANLSSYKFSMVLSEEELYYPGTIYTLDLAEDNSAILDKEVKKTNFFKFDLLNVKLASDAYATAAGVDTTDSAAVLEYAADVEALDYDVNANDVVDVDEYFTITFDNAKSESAQKANLLRTDDDTIFYFIRNKTWNDLKKSEKAKFDDENGDKVVDAKDWELAGHPKADEKIVSVYVGEPEDGDYITFDDKTQLWADKLGRGTADENGVANLVFVIDAVDHSFFTTAQERVHVLMSLTSEYTTEVVYADEIGLDTEEYEEKYYAYYGNFVNLEDGSKISVVYTEDRFVKSQTYNIIEIDENGVAVDAGVTTAWGDADGKVQGARNYALYGIADVNTTQASTAAHKNWGKPDSETSSDGAAVVNYFDWLYCHKMKLDYVDCEKVPTSILDVELVADIIEIDIDDNYYVIDVHNGTAWTTLCDEDDKIDTIKVVDLSNLGAVKTGDDAIKYLANSPVICWMEGTDDVYFEDGCIVFIVGTQIAEF